MIGQIKGEIVEAGLAHSELIVSYLKILLVNASRLKTEQAKSDKPAKVPVVLQALKEYIDRHYKEKHTVSEYAQMLHMSPKALGKLAKMHFNRNITSLIADRIIIEAKRELYLTHKPIKQIAYELGYED